ncbi:3-galactosyl-N-acetylglucosaminide 4-alpha-L-fucosyltransferase FUT3-like [Haliotis rufescens]|uniref:3-galactosyl-N-acetylglucosaminide 4-alpha-L-fucosyltransferase FUT3-like n=1 Tax=Haliotis rufescens TaxID=6454 RepID=UPI00201F08A2|nr:3-galactosyl-N-acetylglucosaminide 4-alpha-L-fucosyltransferase FUT3-like [Haliotis rufescens]
MLRVWVMAQAGRCNYWMYGLRLVKTALLITVASLSLLVVSRYLWFYPQLPPITPAKFLDSGFKDRSYAPKPTQTPQLHNTPQFLKLWAKEKRKNDTEVGMKENIRIQHDRLNVQKNLPKLRKLEQNSSLYVGKKDSETKLIVWHMIPSYRKHRPPRVISCGGYQCITSSNKTRLAEADAILVDAFLLSRNRVKEKPVRTSQNQVWIFFAKEPWANYASRFPGGDWDTVFNWTLTYQRNSDFVASYGDLALKKPKDVVAYNWDDVMKRKTRSVLWFVSNCHSGSRREKYVEELQKYIHVDIVGKCGKPKCMEDNGGNQLSRCYDRYRFYLSFESLFCQDYVTEKLFKTFSYNIVPIVRGKANYAEIYPKNLFLNTADFRSPRDLAKHLKYLEQNPAIYLGYLKRRAQYRVWGRGLGECTICARLHQLDRYRKSYPSITNWFDTCETPQKPYLH